MKDLPRTNEVCRINGPTHWTSEKRQVMVDACREMAIFHYQHNETVRSLYDRYNFDPESINKIDDLKEIPSIGVTAMKHHLLTSRDPDQAVLKLTSSGTNGQKTQIWFDQESLDRVQTMLDMVLEDEGLIGHEPTNFLFFNYDPDQAKNLGTAFTAKNHTRFAPPKRVEFALKMDEQGEWQFDKERILKILIDYQEDGAPLRIKGMPAFIYDFIEFLIEKNICFQFGEKSALFTGGGWKASEDKQVSREEFRSLLSKYFGVPEHRIRDGYGMAEHSAPYFECSHHHLHIPAFNHLIIRDPETMEELPAGEIGLLELISPYNTMMPNLAILSTDWASLDDRPCDCGANSPRFKLHGRAGLSKHAGCALTAENIIKRGQQ